MVLSGCVQKKPISVSSRTLRALRNELVSSPTFDVAELREVVADLGLLYVRIKTTNEDLLRLRSGLCFARVDLSVFDRVWSVG